MISLILQIIKFVIVRLASARILSSFNSQLINIRKKVAFKEANFNNKKRG